MTKETMSKTLHRLHPWHGLTLGDQAPHIVNCYIEIVPTDTVKYELDKDSGILKVDRPNKYSSLCPTLYGLLPQTYAAKRVGAYCGNKTGRPNMQGDGDPLDICVLTEKVIPRGDIMLKAYPIGGFRMIDKGQADDKIIGVMVDDLVYGGYRDIKDCPAALIERLRHYFLTYKENPDKKETIVEITHTFGSKEAQEIIQASREDYQESFL